MGEQGWSLIALVMTVAVIMFGLPYLVGGGGRLRRRGYRDGYGRRGMRGGQIRVGPSLPLVLTSALARRIDTVLLALVTGAVLVLLVVNARA